jgi:AraC-like DNA-binding protein
MAYKKEEEFTDEIDCFWSSREKAVYPSLPEPYINLFFPINSDENPLLKGISSTSDFFNVKSELFGVRLFLKGFYQLNISDCQYIVNKTISLNSFGTSDEKVLISSFYNADSFEDRINVFRSYFKSKKKSYDLTPLQLNITEAFNYFVLNYDDERVIGNCAVHLSVSPRTIQRWFVKDIGISPKKMSRIVRFHKAVDHLLRNEKYFYFDLGYFDQAHFIKEFNEFTGKSPKAFLKMLSDIYNT